MLVLTRRMGETIVVDGDINITVLGISGSKIRLGITAPPAVKVQRAEILHRDLDARAAAVGEPVGAGSS